jgi:hypothetical protein
MESGLVRVKQEKSKTKRSPFGLRFCFGSPCWARTSTRFARCDNNGSQAMLGYLASLSCSLNASISQAKTPNLATRVAACGDLTNQVGGQFEPNKRKVNKKRVAYATRFSFGLIVQKCNSTICTAYLIFLAQMPQIINRQLTVV